MNYLYKINDSVSVSFEVETVAKAFDVMADLHEVYSLTSCGCCGEPVYPRTVVVDGSKYRELVCSACKARLSLFSNREGGGLFPRRKDKQGKWLDNGGWEQWKPKPGTEAPTPLDDVPNF